ncbi:polysaccharide deacetylase family protein [Mesoplasma tabanidae]|uniref:Peptidoglycan-N-acetylglucosamine deacetylase n=1 Tax=Mesoplasma tabanidae TaxID=219745 RepID=A0A2K8P4X2_9MOLU|nr:polysaccharide deacetylase family protein [Mesoplasma tabanidae]ATZ21802.1 peptidoglycan-N-acetylglucosamine deacetylase [Mesoplasma tabanidae]
MKKSVKISIVLIMLVGFIFSISSYKSNREVGKIITKEKVLMLTFDDGPSATDDWEIMNILDQYDVKATFFMTGVNLEKYDTDPGIKKVVDRMIKDGHSLGNHSYYHNKYINNQTQLVKELNDVNDLIKYVYEQNGQTIESKDIPIRMPYLQYYRGLGYVQRKVKNPYWVRGYLGTDYLEEETGKDKILNQYYSHLSNGKILVAHTRGYAKVWLPEFLETLQSQGYKFANFTQNSNSFYKNYGRLGS